MNKSTKYVIKKCKNKAGIVIQVKLQSHRQVTKGKMTVKLQSNNIVSTYEITY